MPDAGSSDDPCSTNYAGSGAASEPETQAVQDEAIRLAPRLLAFVTLHSAAEMWLHPWGHVDEDGECAYADDEDWLVCISEYHLRMDKMSFFMSISFQLPH